MAILENSFEKVRPKMVAARIELLSQLAKFEHDELTCSPAPDDWSALQIAHHVYITDGLALERLRSIQDEENPLIDDPAEEAPRRTRASETPASLEAVLAGMAARREELFEYLSTQPAATWERPFRHPRWGQLKFYQLVNVLHQHDAIHARQLAELKAAVTPAQA
ncbi:MAG TPA: DinB family protein [Ktedonobacteraceae bacterium]|nr:DinB family protein [Ktedonobacteraceae bacterium]